MCEWDEYYEFHPHKLLNPVIMPACYLVFFPAKLTEYINTFAVLKNIRLIMIKLIYNPRATGIKVGYVIYPEHLQEFGSVVDVLALL